jgi:glycosyltransferase involved in cell wall biosynthesis
MRILLTSNASFVPPRGGSTRSNRVWLEHLAWRGHACRVVCGAAPASTPEQQAQIELEAKNQGFVLDASRGDAEVALPSGIVASIHRNLARRPGLLSSEIRSFRPDWVLVSSEDIGHSLLREADESAPGRVVYLAHTPQFQPFGPESWSPDAHAAARVRRAAAVVVIGHRMAAYVREHLGVEAHVIHPRIYGSGPFENLGNFASGYVLMVNPCAVKGSSIFAETARALPLLPFAALPGWGTTASDRAMLSAISNMTLLEPVRQISEVLERTRLLLMPSLWFEGFGLIVMEALLRGIPVVSSDSGGLLEAKHGTGYVLPVEPIREYLSTADEVHMPSPVVPAQSVRQWISAVRELLGDAPAYERESERSREVALDFVYNLRASAMEEMLLSLHPHEASRDDGLAGRLERLSSEQKALLLARVRASRERS